MWVRNQNFQISTCLNCHSPLVISRGTLADNKVKPRGVRSRIVPHQACCGIGWSHRVKTTHSPLLNLLKGNKWDRVCKCTTVSFDKGPSILATIMRCILVRTNLSNEITHILPFLIFLGTISFARSSVYVSLRSSHEKETIRQGSKVILTNSRRDSYNKSSFTCAVTTKQYIGQTRIKGYLHKESERFLQCLINPTNNEQKCNDQTRIKVIFTNSRRDSYNISSLQNSTISSLYRTVELRATKQDKEQNG